MAFYPLILSQSSWKAPNPGHVITDCLFVGWFWVVLFGFHKTGNHKFGKLIGNLDGMSNRFYSLRKQVLEAMALGLDHLFGSPGSL